jgi:c-di-GMP-binding flagellar brake protein YcgR
MQERRKETRISIGHTVDVLDADYGEVIGKLVDISPKGLRIRGPEPVETCTELRLQLRLTERIFGHTTIGLAAVCVWSRPDEESGRYLNGFEFSRVSQEAGNLILGLILDHRQAG